MSNEANISSGLSIRKLSGSVTLLDYRSAPAQFNADVDGTKGPTPGAITVSTAGTNLDLSELTTPGFVRISNQDATNYFEYGIKDASSGIFYPIGEVGPGESYVLKFARTVGDEYYSTTGTDSGNSVHLKANTASVNALVECFER